MHFGDMRIFDKFAREAETSDVDFVTWNKPY